MSAGSRAAESSRRHGGCAAAAGFARRHPAGGIGAVLRHQAAAHRLYLERVPPDGAAGRAGLRSGDEVVDIDGVAVREMDRASVVMRLRGEVGTRVRLSVVADGGTREVEVERAPYAERSQGSR
ncbi:MAG: PDZ domain-containing protein [Polyangiales bacterium]